MSGILYSSPCTVVQFVVEVLVVVLVVFVVLVELVVVVFVLVVFEVELVVLVFVVLEVLLVVLVLVVLVVLVVVAWKGPNRNFDPGVTTLVVVFWVEFEEVVLT